MKTQTTCEAMLEKTPMKRKKKAMVYRMQKKTVHHEQKLPSVALQIPTYAR